MIRLQAKTSGGTVNITGNKIVIAGADEATLYLTAGTNYKNYKDAGHTLAYWKQNEDGGWDKV